MSGFRFGHASATDWRDAAQACIAQIGAGPASLGFLYVTDAYADQLGDILESFRNATEVADWVGTVGMGVCATGVEYLDKPAMVAMVGAFDPGTYALLPTISSTEALALAPVKCGENPANFAIVHGDPRNGDIVELVERLAARTESGFVVGGLTSSRRVNQQIAGGLTHGGLSGVLFSGDVAVATRLTQGCSPIGPKHVITEASRNIVVTLDGRPALDVFREDIGEKLAADLNRVGGTIFAGLPITGSDTGDYLVRNLVGIDPGQKLIAVGELVEQGKPLVFCKRDRKTAAEDMRRMLDSIRQGLFGQPRGGVYYTCLGRGPNLFGDNSEELNMIREALGDFPLVGFFCNGEISHNRLYGYTGVLTLFV